MKSRDFNEGITETLDILNHMDRKYVNKIPTKFMEFLEKNKSSEYVSKLDHSKKLKELELKETTKNLLAIIYMKYWCDENKRKEYAKKISDNEIKYQNYLKDKYKVVF